VDERATLITNPHPPASLGPTSWPVDPTYLDVRVDERATLITNPHLPASLGPTSWPFDPTYLDFRVDERATLINNPSQPPASSGPTWWPVDPTFLDFGVDDGAMKDLTSPLTYPSMVSASSEPLSGYGDLQNISPYHN